MRVRRSSAPTPDSAVGGKRKAVEQQENEVEKRDRRQSPIQEKVEKEEDKGSVTDEQHFVAGTPTRVLAQVEEENKEEKEKSEVNKKSKNKE